MVDGMLKTLLTLGEKIMNKKPKTHVAIVMDRSGSMGRIAQQAIDHYNEQRTQMMENAKDQDITVSLVTFNANVFEHNWLTPAGQLAEADSHSYHPAGATAWYDALGYTIDKLKKTTNPDEDTAYLVISISDGEENDSKHYGNRFNPSVIRSMIDECNATGKWTFTYMGCSDEDIKKVARDIGIPIENMGRWSNENAEVAAHSLRRSTARTNMYYAARAKGQTACSNVYSDVQGLAANFVDDDNQPSSQPDFFKSNPGFEMQAQKILAQKNNCQIGDKVLAEGRNPDTTYLDLTCAKPVTFDK